MDTMDQVMNMEGAPLSRRYYGGQAGRKIGVTFDGCDWLLKYPAATRRLAGSVPSYTTAPLSEYLGSHIYAALGIPVHDTRLAVRDGRIVCACRDFVGDGERLVEFAQLMNYMDEDDLPSLSSPDTTHGQRIVYLADARAALYRVPELAGTEGAAERFWDMFVTDAFIRNIDRNNTNWGLLDHGRERAFTLAPVYDNGNSLGNKKTSTAIGKALDDPGRIRQDALDVRSCYHDDRGHPIAPFKYMRSGDDDCVQALDRFMQRWDPARLDDILAAVPARAYGLSVMDEQQRDYHARVLRARYEQAFTPIWRDTATHITPFDMAAPWTITPDGATHGPNH